MKRRLYFIFPNTHSAQQVHRELLLARIEEKNMHVLARSDIELDDLPKASLFEKSDLVHGLQLGMIVGGFTGVLLAAIAIATEMIAPGMEVLSVGAIIIGGALFGAWSSSMVAVNIQNTRLKQFFHDIDSGKLLYMVDVPVHRVEEIRDMVTAMHPEVKAGGIEPTIPAFP